MSPQQRRSRLVKLTTLRAQIDVEIAGIRAEINAERRKEVMEELGIDYRRVRAQCGTESGYTRHRRLDETPCEECKLARRIGERRRAQRRREKSGAAA